MKILLVLALLLQVGSGWVTEAGGDGVQGSLQEFAAGVTGGSEDNWEFSYERGYPFGNGGYEGHMAGDIRMAITMPVTSRGHDGESLV